LSYLLDTNILSELRRKAPNAGVVEWCSRRPASTLFLSVLTLGELRKGVESLASLGSADRPARLARGRTADLLQRPHSAHRQPGRGLLGDG
jgi:predicted nucleic acid-binding protein